MRPLRRSTDVWDFVQDYAELGSGRDPEKYYGYSKAFMARCKDEGRPFYFMVNSHDPHRPFHNPAKARSTWGTPSRLFTPDEVEVPSYLKDDLLSNQQKAQQREKQAKKASAVENRRQNRRQTKK